MGIRKVHHELTVFLTRYHIKPGWDRLYALLKEHSMLANKKASKVATTESNHRIGGPAALSILIRPKT